MTFIEWKLIYFIHWMCKRHLNTEFIQDTQNKRNTNIGMKLQNALNLVTSGV